MLYICTHTTTVGVKRLKEGLGSLTAIIIIIIQSEADSLGLEMSVEGRDVEELLNVSRQVIPRPWSCHRMYSVSQKIPPAVFWHFSQMVGNFFTNFFTHLLHVHTYARMQIFIQLSPILTNLFRTEWDHPSNF